MQFSILDNFVKNIRYKIMETLCKLGWLRLVYTAVRHGYWTRLVNKAGKHGW